MLEDSINQYISSQLIKDPTLLPLDNDALLPGPSVLNSLTVLQLVIFLERQFGITLASSEIVAENFASVNAISACIRRHLPERPFE